jgi:hypothetical protein
MPLAPTIAAVALWLIYVGAWEVAKQGSWSRAALEQHAQ